MDYTAIRKTLLKMFLVFLGLTALIGIVSVMYGTFGEFQAKILATCATISVASSCAMSCAAFMEKKKRHKDLGIYGIISSVVAAIFLIIGIWLEIKGHGFWKSTFILMTIALAFAYAFVIVLRDLGDRYKWVQQASAVSIGVLAFQIILALWLEIEVEGYYRLVAVVSIIVGLETLSIPILVRLRKGDGEISVNQRDRSKLVLKQVVDSFYRDSEGNGYKVVEMEGEDGQSSGII